jgi:hypothetical protein
VFEEKLNFLTQEFSKWDSLNFEKYSCGFTVSFWV